VYNARRPCTALSLWKAVAHALYPIRVYSSGHMNAYVSRCRNRKIVSNSIKTQTQTCTDTEHEHTTSVTENLDSQRLLDRATGEVRRSSSIVKPRDTERHTLRNDANDDAARHPNDHPTNVESSAAPCKSTRGILLSKTNFGSDIKLFCAATEIGSIG